MTSVTRLCIFTTGLVQILIHELPVPRQSLWTRSIKCTDSIFDGSLKEVYMREQISAVYFWCWKECWNKRSLFRISFLVNSSIQRKSYIARVDCSSQILTCWGKLCRSSLNWYPNPGTRITCLEYQLNSKSNLHRKWFATVDRPQIKQPDFWSKGHLTVIKSAKISFTIVKL